MKGKEKERQPFYAKSNRQLLVESVGRLQEQVDINSTPESLVAELSQKAKKDAKRITQKAKTLSRCVDSIFQENVDLLSGLDNKGKIVVGEAMGESIKKRDRSQYALFRRLVKKGLIDPCYKREDGSIDIDSLKSSSAFKDDGKLREKLDYLKDFKLGSKSKLLSESLHPEGQIEIKESALDSEENNNAAIEEQNDNYSIPQDKRDASYSKNGEVTEKTRWQKIRRGLADAYIVIGLVGGTGTLLIRDIKNDSLHFPNLSDVSAVISKTNVKQSDQILVRDNASWANIDHGLGKAAAPSKDRISGPLGYQAEDSQSVPLLEDNLFLTKVVLVSSLALASTGIFLRRKFINEYGTEGAQNAS